MRKLRSTLPIFAIFCVMTGSTIAKATDCGPYYVNSVYAGEDSANGGSPLFVSFTNGNWYNALRSNMTAAYAEGVINRMHNDLLVALLTGKAVNVRLLDSTCVTTGNNLVGVYIIR